MAEARKSFWSRPLVRGIASAIVVLVTGLVVATYEHWLDSNASPARSSTEQTAQAPRETPTTDAASVGVIATAGPQPTRRPDPTPTPEDASNASSQRRWDRMSGFTNWPENRTWDIADGSIVRNDDVEQVAYMSPAELDGEGTFRIYITFDDVPPPPDVSGQMFGLVIENEGLGTWFWIGIMFSPNPGQSWYFVEYFDGTRSIPWLSQQVQDPLDPGRVQLDVAVNAGFVNMAVNGEPVLAGQLVYMYEADRVGVFATTSGVRVTELIISAS